MKRLYRSVLFCPGNKIKFIEKILYTNDIKADAVVLDLEDAVSLQHKSDARSIVIDKLKNLKAIYESSSTTTTTFTANGVKRKSIIVRINDPYSNEGKDDIAMLSEYKSQIHIDSILIPKVENRDVISYTIDRYNSNISIWAMIETPRGVINCNSIASMPSIGSYNQQHLSALVFGSNDLTKDIKAKHTNSREPLLYSLSRTVIAARANNLLAIDGVHLDVNNVDELQQHCRQGKLLGFDGKTLIHPNQVAYTNKIFSPSNEEYIAAKNVITKYQENMSNRNDAVVLIDGNMVEELHYKHAIAVVDEYESIISDNLP